MSDRLLAVATTHHGVLTARDAAMADVDANGLAALVRAGVLVRVRRGAYVLAEAWHAASPEEQLALRTRAVLRSRAPSPGAATHCSALALHGLPLHGVALGVVDATGPVNRVRTEAGLRLHPVDDGAPPAEVAGCQALPVATALVQVALRDGRDPVVVAADAALSRGAVTHETIAAEVRRLARTRRVAVRVSGWMRLLDPASESVGESRTRLLLHDLGYAARSQVSIADADGSFVARVDLLVGDRVVVEFDGLVKYSGADGREALAAEKRREDRLRALGYEVVRVTWADLGRPQRVAALVRAALARAGERAPGRASAS